MSASVVDGKIEDHERLSSIGYITGFSFYKPIHLIPHVAGDTVLTAHEERCEISFGYSPLANLGSS